MSETQDYLPSAAEALAYGRGYGEGLRDAKEQDVAALIIERDTALASLAFEKAARKYNARLRDEARASVASLESALASANRECEQLRTNNEALADMAQTALDDLDRERQERFVKEGGLEIALGQWKAECEQSRKTIADMREANERMRAALEPFATFSDFATERTEDGWAWQDHYGRERIYVWFGPSDFGIARALSSRTQGGNDEAE